MEMPVAGKQARQNSNRKVIKLPSDMSNEPTTPIERPWEVRVPKRNATPASISGSKTGSTGSPASSADKGPTPRRKAGATGTTGKIPAIKHPTHESGKIPAEERASSRVGKAAAAGVTTPILIDDFATEAPATASFSSTNDGVGTRQRRSVRYDATAASGNGGGKKRFIAIIIAILVVCCIVAFGIFFSSPASNTRTVSFDTDGGTIIGNQYIVDNGKLERPANPTRPGYTFDGWYYDANYNEEVSFPVDVTQDMTLYAKWKEEKATSTLPGLPSANTPGAATPDSSSTSNGATAGNSSNNSGSSSTSGTTSGGSNSGSGSASSGGAISGSSGSGSGGTSGGAGGSAGGGSGTGGNSGDSNLNGPGVSNGAVNVSMVAANGRTLTGTVNLHDGYVIPNSSEKAYTIDELRALGLNDAELCIARNEPYARQGYSFRNPGLQAYFNSRSWYHNTGWRGELPADSAGYITAHNLLTLAEETPGASAWLRLRTY